jgi:hypothetical protein
MNKFNNTLAGTDCGDAGLPLLSSNIARAKTVLRIVPKAPDIVSTVIQFSERRDRAGARAAIPGDFHGLARQRSNGSGTSEGCDAAADGAGSRHPSRR